ncbi:MAG: cysteine desulfuration protein SufE [Thiotrichales bacterium]|nr:cysteine desulfuration protein SufE [Thiotrichales bacterium]|tara:strand:+ start:138 stop:554 length:417 start_codon:yes stop_codon:yes gene_type:complete
MLTLDRILGNFEILFEWEERYRYIIDLGKQIESLEDVDRIEANRVQGCVSNVWLVTQVSEEQPPKLRFRADSDAHIVRGLLVILLTAYSDKTAEEILDVDINAIFEQLELSSHLSPSRSNGFFSMVERIRSLAGELAA